MNFRISALLIAIAISSNADIRTSDPLFKDSAVFDYVIISASDPGILQQANRLSNLKWEKGLKTAVVTVDSICAAFDGTDTPHKIRNFLKMAYTEWNITWVLLLGDLEKIPARKVSSGGLYFPYDTTSIASDVYYSCLDGEWDVNNDGIYGNEETWSIDPAFLDREPDSSLVLMANPNTFDLWYDVYLGRLPASNGDEAKIMVDKIIAYTSTPRPEQYTDDILMLGAQVHCLWPSAVDGIEIDDVTNYWHYNVKPQFDSAAAFSAMGVDEVFEDTILDDGTARNDSIEITHEKMSEYLSRGYNMVFFTFHGNPRGLQICSFNKKADYDYTYVRKLQSNYYSNIISISCSVMKMIPDSNFCFAKSFLVNPNGGGVSYTGASCIDYFYVRGRQYASASNYLCEKNVRRISQAFQLANIKEFCRHNMFVHQHWGDPEVELWTQSEASTFRLKIDASISYGKFRVNVSPSLDSVLVCLYKKGEVFYRGYTKRGTVEFPVTRAPASDITVSATYSNYISAQTMLNPSPVALRTTLAGHQSPAVRFATAFSETRIIFANMHAPVTSKIMTASGRIIHEFSGADKYSVWILPRLSSGIYLLKTASGEYSSAERFIIKQ